MSEKLIQDTTLQGIANAIRGKDGTSASIQVSDFADRIEAIPSGSDTLAEVIDNSIENYELPTGTTVIKPFQFYQCDKLTLDGLENVVELGANAITSIINKKLNMISLTTTPTLCAHFSTFFNSNKNNGGVEEIYLPLLTGTLVLNGYINGQKLGSLKKIVARRVTTGQFRGNALLTHVYLPNSAGSNRICNLCDSLVEVLINGDIGTEAFNTGVSNPLEFLVIPNSTAVNLSSTGSFNNTAIARGTGYIYVPRSTIATYEGMTNWSVVKDYAQDGTFRAIEDYLPQIEARFEYFREDFPQFYPNE